VKSYLNMYLAYWNKLFYLKYVLLHFIQIKYCLFYLNQTRFKHRLFFQIYVDMTLVVLYYLVYLLEKFIVLEQQHNTWSFMKNYFHYLILISLTCKRKLFFSQNGEIMKHNFFFFRNSSYLNSNCINNIIYRYIS